MKKTTLPLSMRRNCNLDLCLLPPPSSLQSTDSGGDSVNEGTNRSPQQLTIFYDGRICVCDVTELQARAILWFARREMDEKMSSPGSEPASPSLQSQLHSPTGMSMKRSLQLFLQKRRNRIQATSPY